MDEILSQWDDAAEIYLSTQEASANVKINEEVVKNRFSDLSGKAVLDAGCGYGVFTDYFTHVGADVIGCDGSGEMLRIAKEKYPACEFQLVDMQKKLPYCDDQFDIVFCNQVLMDIPEVQTLFSEFSRITRENGILFFAIVHPVTYPGEWIEDKNGRKTSKIINNYTSIYKIEHNFCRKTTHFHRPISFYFNLAAKNNFYLVNMDEPCIYNNVSDVSNLPLFLFAEFKKHVVCDCPVPEQWVNKIDS